jgi:hypothetical protein
VRRADLATHGAAGAVVDDAPAALLQVAERRLVGEHRAHQVDAEHGRRVLGREALRGTAALDPGDVGEHVEPSEPGYRVAYSTLHLVRARHVAVDVARALAGGADAPAPLVLDAAPRAPSRT